MSSKYTLRVELSENYEIETEYGRVKKARDVVVMGEDGVQASGAVTAAYLRALANEIDGPKSMGGSIHFNAGGTTIS